MKIICAWCKCDLGEKYPEQPGVSHTICESCAKRVKEERVNQVKRQADEHCSCGHRLRTALELDTGLCATCLYRENEEDVLVPMEDGESLEWESKKGARA